MAGSYTAQKKVSGGISSQNFRRGLIAWKSIYQVEYIHSDHRRKSRYVVPLYEDKFAARENISDRGQYSISSSSKPKEALLEARLAKYSMVDSMKIKKSVK
jgi:hypothetical protein